jgi:hypothetical protein
MVLKLWIADWVKLPEEFRDQIMMHDFSLLCTIAENVLPVGMKETADRTLKPIIAKFRELNNHRVRIAHGWWIVGGRSGWVSHVSRQKLKSTNFYNDPSQITALADAAYDLDIELRRWYRENTLPSSTN